MDGRKALDRNGDSVLGWDIARLTFQLYLPRLYHDADLDPNKTQTAGSVRPRYADTWTWKA
jgi:hypothetical protein